VDTASEKPRRISDAFASALRSGRSEFNAQFVEARRLYPELDGAAFLEFLQTYVDLLIRTLEQIRSERVAEVVMAAYDASLELVGQKLVGIGARNHLIEEGWRRLLTPIASLVATAPARILSAVSNALHNLETTPGTRPDQWLTEMERLGPQCKDANGFLRLGQVAGWRAGLAHFRQGAIAAANELAVSLALAAVGAPSTSEWPEIRKRLLADPWFDPAAPLTASNGEAIKIQVMTQAGAFRGFGGVFVEPPRVAAAGEHFLVRSGDENWLLAADRFGATFHRTNLADFDLALQNSKLPPGLRVADSKVIWGKERFEIAGLGKFTSAAANLTTLALTSELTHSVILVALR
jgi:hypothetical protein